MYYSQFTDVWLDGIGLQSLDPSIVVVDVQEKVPKTEVESHNLPTSEGLLVTKNRRVSLSVVVQFAIIEQNIRRREDVLQKVRSWASQGKYLKMTHKEEKRLRVYVDSLPTLSSVNKYTGTLSVTFIAYYPPYWELDCVDKLTLSGSSGNGSFYIRGDDLNVLVDASIKPNGSLSDLTLKVGRSSITLTGFSVNQEVTFSHVNDRWLAIKAGDVDLLPYRTPDSSDDLITSSGCRTDVSFSANCNVSITVSARGLWM